MSRKKILEMVEKICSQVLEKTKENILELEDGEIAEIYISGWIERVDNGYNSDIWHETGRIKDIGTIVTRVAENSDILGFEPGSRDPESRMLGHYTTGLCFAPHTRQYEFCKKRLNYFASQST